MNSHKVPPVDEVELDYSFGTPFPKMAYLPVDPDDGQISLADLSEETKSLTRHNAKTHIVNALTRARDQLPSRRGGQSIADKNTQGGAHNDAHNEQVEQMLDAGPDVEGRYTDPVSGRRFPLGMQMVKNPTRAERRRLKTWRRTGKVKGKRGEKPMRERYL